MSGIRERLVAGDVLRILFADGVGFDVWAEKYANPPRVYFEGRPQPIAQLDDVVARCEAYLAEDDVKALWNGVIPARKP